MRINALLVALLLAVLATSAQALTVRVVAAESDVPIEGARVAVWAKGFVGPGVFRRTDAEGVADLPNPGEGEIELLVTAPGRVRVQAGVRKDSVLVRLLKAHLVEGRVLSKATGKPVVGAAVTIFAGGARGSHASLGTGPAYADTVTDDEGRFTTHGTPARKLVTVRVASNGFVRAERSLVIREARESAPLDFRLTVAGRIDAIVTDAEGKPVAGAVVYVLPLSAPDFLWRNPDGRSLATGGAGRSRFHLAEKAETDDRGRVSHRSVPLDEPVKLMAKKKGYAFSGWSGPVRAARGDPIPEAVLRLSAGARIMVTVVDEEGRPVQDANVHLDSPLPRISKGSSVVFEDVAPGRHRLAWWAAGTVRSEQQVEAKPGAVIELRVVTDRGLTLAGVVVDDRGEPVAGALVKAAGPKGSPSRGRAMTGDDGAFEISGLLKGPHLVTVKVGGYDVVETGVSLPAARPTKVITRRLATISGRFVVPEGMEPPRKAGIDVRRKDPKAIVFRSVRPKSGAFRVNRLPAGAIDIEIYPVGFAPVVLAVKVAPGGTLDLGEILLDPGFTLEGRVVDTEGGPVAGAEVYVWASGAAPGQKAVTEEEGRFRLHHCAAGTILFEVEAEGFLATEVEMEIRPGIGPITVTLSRGSMLKGAVVNADGTPLDGHLGLRIRCPESYERSEHLYTEEDGTFLVRLHPGTYVVEIHDNVDDDRVYARLKDVKIEKGKTTEIRLVLDED